MPSAAPTAPAAAAVASSPSTMLPRLLIDSWLLVRTPDRTPRRLTSRPVPALGGRRWESDDGDDAGGRGDEGDGGDGWMKGAMDGWRPIEKGGMGCRVRGAVEAVVRGGTVDTTGSPKDGVRSGRGRLGVGWRLGPCSSCPTTEVTFHSGESKSTRAASTLSVSSSSTHSLLSLLRWPSGDISRQTASIAFSLSAGRGGGVELSR
mmetsp:Transcript_10317/g.24954  ORF Transcript_10317/g.24954 Transcript_10317/m.24954 type:complete len:205 (-) Transcript_10317:606-1220(-)